MPCWATVQMPSGTGGPTVAPERRQERRLAGRRDPRHWAMRLWQQSWKPSAPPCAAQIAARRKNCRRRSPNCKENQCLHDFAYPLHEECGVLASTTGPALEDVAAAAYSALYAPAPRAGELRHRRERRRRHPGPPGSGRCEIGAHPGGAGRLANPNAHMAKAMCATPPPAAASGPMLSP